MMSRRIFFFDIDGTLCLQNKVSSRVKDAIMNIQKNGDLCFIASGRPPTFIQDAVKDIPFDGYILVNGAYATYHDQMIYEVKMNENELKELCLYLREHHCDYILQTRSNNYLDKQFTRLYDFFNMIGIKVNSFIRDFDEDEVIKDVIKVEIWPDNEQVSQDVVERFKNFTWHQYINSNMEVCISGISKAWGIKKVIDYFDIDIDNTYCFGDGCNDIDMFKTVEHSYAMGNADEDVKAYAKYVCPSIEEDGVAVILEQLLEE